jgi:hypothetical protein
MVQYIYYVTELWSKIHVTYLWSNLGYKLQQLWWKTIKVAICCQTGRNTSMLPEGCHNANIGCFRMSQSNGM